MRKKVLGLTVLTSNVTWSLGYFRIEVSHLARLAIVSSQSVQFIVASIKSAMSYVICLFQLVSQSQCLNVCFISSKLYFFNHFLIPLVFPVQDGDIIFFISMLNVVHFFPEIPGWRLAESWPNLSRTARTPPPVV